MCGIGGELRFDGAASSRACLQRMLAHLEHRGPDRRQAYTDGIAGLVHARLAVIDLSPTGDQPMRDDELGLVLVFNGVIYNYRELKSDLAAHGYRFFSSSDSEVILKAWHRWGGDCVQHLDGIFAFAIWVRAEGALFLARDRLGIKPLYYTHDARRFRFASNPQALLAAAGVDTAIDPVALHRHLTLHAVVPAPRTLLRGVRKLAPARCMKITATEGRIVQRRYWTLRAQRADPPPADDEWPQIIRDELSRAVETRLRIADVPVGVLLSGGLDSSLLVALLAEAGVNRIRTYTIGFDDRGSECGEEFRYSDLVGRRFETVHHRFRVSDEQLFARLPAAIGRMSEPMPAQDCVAFHLLAEQVAADVKVVQTGQGADEVFAGYFWYPQMQARSGSRIERFRPHYFDRTHDEYLRGIAPGMQVPDVTSPQIEALLEDEGADTFMDAVLRMDATTLIVDDPVKRVDNMTMAWGVEARVPFLDCRLVETAMRMPPELKLAGGGKHVLKQIARDLLPAEIIDRRKGYFPVPALKFVHGRFHEMMADVLTSSACRERGLFDPDYVAGLINGGADDKLTPIHGNKLWHFALLEMWLQTHVDGAAAAPEAGAA